MSESRTLSGGRPCPKIGAGGDPPISFDFFFRALVVVLDSLLMERRAFFFALPTAPLLVKAGMKLPPLIVPATSRVSLDAINAITVKRIVPGIVDHFFRRDPLLAYLRKEKLVRGSHYRPPEQLKLFEDPTLYQAMGIVCPGCGELECECVGGEDDWEDEC